MLSWISKILLAIIIILGHVILSNSNNFLFSSIILPIIFLVLFINFFDIPTKLIFVIFWGLILDIYSNLPFGSFLTTLFLVEIFLDILFYNFFTDQSFYSSLVLLFSGLTIYNFVLMLIIIASYFLGFTDWFINQRYIEQYLSQLLINGCLIIIGFYWFNKLAK